MNLPQLLTSQILWSQKTFGPGFRPERILRHIEKEIAEVRLQPTDVVEWVDIALLALDGAWRASVGGRATVSPLGAMEVAEQVSTVLFEKALTNIHLREYSAPVDNDEPTEHIRKDMSMIEAVVFMHSHPTVVLMDDGPGDNLWRFVDPEFYFHSTEEHRWIASNPFCYNGLNFRVVEPSEYEGLLCRDTGRAPDSPETMP